MEARKTWIRSPLLLGLVILALLLPGLGAGAAPLVPLGPQDVASPQGADDGSLDVGAESIGDAPPWGAAPAGVWEGDLPAANGASWNFYSQMRNAGYTGSHDFRYTDNNAYESDFTKAPAGNEEWYADNVDIVYFHDHGNGGVGAYFPWGGHNDNWLQPSECSGAWGTKDMEWIALGGCSDLSDALRLGWANCMNGVHLIVGYKTTAYDGNWGGIWADQMLGWQWLGIWWRSPKSVTQAWFTQCDQTQPSGVAARVIAEDWRHFDDRVWNRGGPAYGDVVDNTYWWMDHNCYKAPPTPVDTDAVNTLPIYTTQYPTVDQAYAQSIASTLDMTGTVQYNEAALEWALTDTTGGFTVTLSVDAVTGAYVYQNLSQLWVPADPSSPLSLPDPAQAGTLAGNFILGHAALPAILNHDESPALSQTENAAQVAKATGASEGAPEQILQESAVDVMVAYGRHLSTVLPGLEASAVVTRVSVIGPGSTTKVYYGGSPTRSLAENVAFPAGLVGGSPNVTMDMGKPATIVNAADDAWTEFQADHQLAIVPLPYDADEITRKPVSDTLGYYAQPAGVSQDEMIPAWVFYATFSKDSQLVAADVPVYVPASADYYPPDVTITAPISNTFFWPGVPITFTATATGGYEPFTYTWESSVDGDLGTGATIQNELSVAWHAGVIANQTVSVKVTNSNGQSRTANVVLRAPVSIFLPTILKNQTGF